MTPREVSVVLEGARWRQRQAARQALTDAWQTAAFMRYRKLPNLKSFMRRFDRAVEGPRVQEPAEVWATLKDIAIKQGFRITRHAKSVLPNG